MADLVWSLTKADALTEAKANNKRILLLGGKDECSVCNSMKDMIAASPVKEIVDKYYVLWYGKITLGTAEWSYMTSGTFALPFIAILDYNNLDTPLSTSFGRQDVNDFCDRLKKYSCGDSCTETVTTDKYSNLDTDKMYSDFKIGLDKLVLNKDTDWCGGLLLKRNTFVGLTISFTDNVTQKVVSALQNFSKEDVLTKLYDVFPTIKSTFDTYYCKNCTITIGTVSSSGTVVQTEPLIILNKISSLNDINLKSILEQIVGKINW